MTAKPRLLLVEDTPSILHLYHEFLAKLDIELIDAATGARANEVLRETIPDVVLLDLELPDTNGIEILRTIRSRKLPCAVIVVTAQGSLRLRIVRRISMPLVSGNSRSSSTTSGIVSRSTSFARAPVAASISSISSFARNSW